MEVEKEIANESATVVSVRCYSVSNRRKCKKWLNQARKGGPGGWK
jgi:hypothetical protein